MTAPKPSLTRTIGLSSFVQSVLSRRESAVSPPSERDSRAQAEALAESVRHDTTQAMAHSAPAESSSPPPKPFLHRLDHAVFEPETQMRLQLALEGLDGLPKVCVILSCLYTGFEDGGSTGERKVQTQGRGCLKVGRGESVRGRSEGISESRKSEKVGAKRRDGESASVWQTSAKLHEIPSSVCSDRVSVLPRMAGNESGPTGIPEHIFDGRGGCSHLGKFDFGVVRYGPVRVARRTRIVFTERRKMR